MSYDHERIEPYLYEAGLDIDHLKTYTRLIGQDLMLYQVIHKCKLELDDIKKGYLFFMQLELFPR